MAFQSLHPRLSTGMKDSWDFVECNNTVLKEQTIFWRPFLQYSACIEYLGGAVTKLAELPNEKTRLYGEPRAQAEGRQWLGLWSFAT